MRYLTNMAILTSIICFLLACPSPKYPKCDKDEHCKKGEFCVNGQCQQCRDNKDCPKGEECNSGRCEPIPNICETSADCQDGMICKNKRCLACSKDTECSTGHCKNGKCVQCVFDKDCPENHECQNNVCIAPPEPASEEGPCSPKPVYFDFNEFILTSQATATLQEAVKCIKSVPNRNIRVEGHCDSRGTEEYNLALGDRRAKSVVQYLKRMGIPKNRLRSLSKGKLEATGSDENSWVLDRKVIFIWE